MLFLILWALFTWASYAIGKGKGRPGAGLALGLCLGFIGLIIIALLPPVAPQARVYTSPQVLSTPVQGPALIWVRDPTERHQLRQWDGQRWTDQVSDWGKRSTDPIDY